MKSIRIVNVFALNAWFYFWAPFVFVFCLVTLASVVACVRVFKPARVMYFFRRAISIYGRAVVLTAWPWIRVRLVNAPAADGGPYVFVENHASSFDPFIQTMLPYEVIQAARGWALRFLALGCFARWAGYIDVDSDDVVEKAACMLAGGVSVVFFPEGTRGDGINLAPFHSAAFRAAHEAGAAIVPLVVRGISDKPAKGSLVMHPGVIEMKCLAPVGAEEVKGTKPFELKKNIRNTMLRDLGALRDAVVS